MASEQSLVGVEKAHGQSSPDAATSMDCEGTDRIINFEAVNQCHCEDDDDSTDEAHHPGRRHRDGIAARRDTHQTSKNAVDCHGDIRFAWPLVRAEAWQLGGQGGCDAATSCTKGCGDSDVGHLGSHRKPGAGVESIPANPEDQATKGGDGHVVARNRLGLAVNELANPGAEDDGPHQTSPATHRVNHSGAGKINETETIQPATTEAGIVGEVPLPATHNWVNETHQKDREDDKSSELNTFSHQA